MVNRTPRVYCSGPLHCPEEVGGMRALAGALESAGMKTFLPQRDGLEAYVLRFAASAMQAAVPLVRDTIDRAIFALDVYEIVEGCDALVLNMNGRVPDEGGVVEAAVAYCAGKPLVLYKQDVRAPFGGRDNAMLTGLAGGRVVGRLGDVPAAVLEQYRLAPPSRAPRHPGELAATVDAGRRISGILRRLPLEALKQRWPAGVLDEVAAACREGLGSPDAR
jgi:nucleoside 2-deoxyribosyltransferase